MANVMHPLQALLADPHIAQLRHRLDAARVLDEAVIVQQIPSPTFNESRRAQYTVEALSQALPGATVETDDMFNVYACWPGQQRHLPALLLYAHSDTVFPVDTDLSVKREEKRIAGPGIGDNSLGVAALLEIARIIGGRSTPPPTDIWFVVNSREEGLGNLDGIRAAWERLGTRLGAAIVIEGMALGRVYHSGIAVRRLRLSCHAPGGHSWLHFGQPSAIHGLLELGARIVALKPPIEPRTTFNVGLIEGGHSINSLATDASLYLDLRSRDTGALAALEADVMRLMRDLDRPQLTWRSEIVGDRPAGHLSRQHPLVGLARAALAAVNLEAVFESGSTDANWLLAQGLPTVTIGVSYGRYAHRLDEFIETEPVADGMWQLLLLTLATAHALPAWALP